MYYLRVQELIWIYFDVLHGGRDGVVGNLRWLHETNTNRAFKCLNAHCIQCVETDLLWLDLYVYEGKTGPFFISTST